MTKSRRAGLLIVFLTVFIDLLGFGIVMPLLPRYGRHFQASGPMLGLLMASFSAMQFVFAPFWGRLSDRIGRRPVIMIGLAASMISYAGFGLATSVGRTGSLLGLSALTWLFITRIGAGIGGATIATAQAYIADMTGAGERAKGMALIGAAFGMGFTFGPLLGAGFVSSAPAVTLNDGQLAALQTIAEQSDAETALGELEELGPVTRADRDAIRSIFSRDENVDARVAALVAPPSAAPGYVAAVLSGLALVCAIILLPESKSPDSQPAAAHWLSLTALRATITRPVIGHLLVTIFLTTFAFAQFESTLSLLTEDLGLSDRGNFFVFAYIGLVLTLSQGFIVRRLVSKIGEYKMAAAGVVAMTIGLALIGLVPAFGFPAGVLYAVLPVAVIGFSAVTPSLQSLLSRRTPDTEQGSVLGLGQSLSSLARILGPMLGLTLIDRSTVLPYVAGTALMAVGTVLVLMLKQAAPEDEPEAA